VVTLEEHTDSQTLDSLVALVEGFGGLVATTYDSPILKGILFEPAAATDAVATLQTWTGRLHSFPGIRYIEEDTTYSTQELRRDGNGLGESAAELP